MAGGRKPDYNVCVSKSNGENGRATRVGAGWIGDKGQINIRLNIPLLVPEGYDLVLFENKEGEPE